MKKFLTIIGFLVILFPNISQAMQSASVVIDIPLFPEAPQGKLITGENGESYVAFTLEEYSKIIDDYKGIYKLRMNLFDAEATIGFLNAENHKLDLSLSELKYNYFSLVVSKEKQRKRFIAASIIIATSTLIASGFMGAAAAGN